MTFVMEGTSNITGFTMFQVGKIVHPGLINSE